jgi:prepilin-type N-terminal cleavage/methylation domain-containing protein
MSDIIRQRAFTLMEMLVVIVIIGILGTLSITHFMGSQESALDKEAYSNLKLIAAAEKIYRMEAGEYVAAGNETAINTALRLMLPTGATRKWRYSVTRPGGVNTFEARSNRTGVTRNYTMNQADEEPH